MEDGPPDSLEGWVPLRPRPPPAPGPAPRVLVGWHPARGFAVCCPAAPGARGWAGQLSAAGLAGALRALGALWPPLERAFPELPGRLRALAAPGLWARLRGDGDPGALCEPLQDCLRLAAGACGAAAVRAALFPGGPDAEPGPDADDADAESPRAFRERELRAARGRAEASLSRLLRGHESMGTLVALMQLYQEEDEAFEELVTRATVYSQHLLQPFRSRREVATSRKLAILKSLEEEDLGPKRVAALQSEAQEWAWQAQQAVVAIQDLTVEYFTETVKALAGMQKQMEQDEKRFGRAAWATAAPRLEKLKLTLARETLQLLRAKELCLNHQRAGVQGKMEDLPEQEKSTDAVNELEIQYYEVQLELYEVKFEMLKYEELLLITQLDSIKRQIKDKQEEVIYYDACQSQEELPVVQGELQQEGPQVEVLRQQCRQLETRRGRICARRAQLRSLQGRCKESHRLRLQQAGARARHFQQHHSVQMKRDKNREEEQKKKDWVHQERQKTLQRLRAFREKHLAQSAPRASSSEPGAEDALTTSPATASVRPSSEMKGGTAPSTQDVDMQSPKCPGCPAGAHVTVPVGDQMQPELWKEVPPAPGPPPAPSPPPPPPLLPALSFPTLRGFHRRTSREDEPLPLVCDPPTEAPSALLVRDTGPGSMDEVLASLRSRRTPPQQGVRPPPDPQATSILAAIRQGVVLRKVAGGAERPSRAAAGDLERSIREALQRIKRVSADSEEDDEEDEQAPGEWDH